MVMLERLERSLSFSFLVFSVFLFSLLFSLCFLSLLSARVVTRRGAATARLLPATPRCGAAAAWRPLGAPKYGPRFAGGALLAGRYDMLVVAGVPFWG
jgi:hypothetical protein